MEGEGSPLAAPRASLGLHRRGVYLDLSGGARRRGGTHAVLDLGRHRHEGLLHVRSVLGRGLQEGDAQLVGVLLRGWTHGRVLLTQKKFRTTQVFPILNYCTFS